jgi:hypothetical protein
MRQRLRFSSLALVSCALLSLFDSALTAQAPPPAITCDQVQACPGPRIAGTDFALLVSPVSTAAAAPAHWGEYVKLQLVLTNTGRESLRFDPAQVVVATAEGTTEKPVPVVEFKAASTGHFSFGGPPDTSLPGCCATTPTGTTYPGQGGRPPILRGPNGEPVSTDPVNHITSELESRRLKTHENELKKALRDQLTATDVNPGETIAGYVLIPASKSQLKSTRVEFGRTFVLPLR